MKRTDVNRVVDKDGVVIFSEIVEVDITEEFVAGSLRDLSDQALASNRLFLRDNSITNAKVTAQVKELTKQNQALIRLVLNKLDGVD